MKQPLPVHVSPRLTLTQLEKMARGLGCAVVCKGTGTGAQTVQLYRNKNQGHTKQ